MFGFGRFVRRLDGFRGILIWTVGAAVALFAPAFAFLAVVFRIARNVRAAELFVEFGGIFKFAARFRLGGRLFCAAFARAVSAVFAGVLFDFRLGRA